MTDEIRNGRKLMRRKIAIPIGFSTDFSDEVGDVDIIFVHGSCASSNQYNSMLECLAANVAGDLRDVNEEDVDHTGPQLTCYLFDSLGCGESDHSPHDWYAYSTDELDSDLEAITRLVLGQESCKPDTPLFLVGHSFGVSQVIRLVNKLNAEKFTDRIKGVVLISGAINGGPLGNMDGGHWIFRYLPLSVLRRIQPILSQSFFKAAVHPSNQQRLQKSANDLSNANDMAMCRAFYRQQKYATVNDAKALEVRILGSGYIFLSHFSFASIDYFISLLLQMILQKYLRSMQLLFMEKMTEFFLSKLVSI
mmetsp:Transcript_3450/g.4805  ORF Transcript_3450/g.4805 Transcript_3450/m.4805 type:complete len:307 (+) Transcript_3450:99-1019(+)